MVLRSLGYGGGPQEHAAHSVGYFVARAAPAALAAVSVGVFIRIIGTAEYGRYSLIYALVLTVAGFATQWVSQAVLRYQSGFSGRSRAGFRRVVDRAAVLTSVGGTACLLLLAPWLAPSSAAILVAAAAALVTQIAYGIAAARVQAELDVRRFAWAEAARSGGAVCASFAAVLTIRGHGAFGLLLGNGVGTAAGWFVLQRQRVPFPGAARSSDRRIARLVFSYGWPMAVWSGASVLLNLSDRYIIARFFSLAVVGVYSAVYDVVYKGVGLLLTPIVLATHPLAMRAWNAGHARKAAGVLGSGVRVQLMVGGGVLVCCALLGRFVTQLTLGRSDPVAARIVGPIAAGAVLWQIAMLAHKPMELAGRTRTMAVFCFCSFGANVCLNLWLVPWLGYGAAAFSTVAGVLVYLALCLAWLQGSIGKRIVAALTARHVVAVGPRP